MINDATLKFITQHQDDDVRKLAFSGNKNPEVDMVAALQQIQGRQKAKKKLPEYYGNPDILFPSSVSMEQCSSTTTAHYKAGITPPAGSMADLTGGFGVDTFALAKKFSTCHYVEPQEELVALARHNAQALGIGNLIFHQTTMEEFLKDAPVLDFIYLDPSRRDEHGRRVVTLADCTPDISIYIEKLLQIAPQVLVKLSPMIDLKQTISMLPQTFEIHIVAINNECKEILLKIGRREAADDTVNLPFHTVNFRQDKCEKFSFTEKEELQLWGEFGNPAETFPNATYYLYEPNVAILKAGGYRSLAKHYGLLALSPKTHLYFADHIIEDFPGRAFKVEDQFPFHKKESRTRLKGLKQANVAVRNFPLTAEELKLQLKLKDGGDTYLFGGTDSQNEKWVFVGRR